MKLPPISNCAKCRLEIRRIAGGMEADGKDLRVEARVMGVEFGSSFGARGAALGFGL